MLTGLVIQNQAIKDQDLLLPNSRYNTRRIVFVNKKGLKNTGISITKSHTKRMMEFLKKVKTNLDLAFGWLMDGYVKMR